MQFKQGDTFDYSGPVEVLDDDDQPVDLTGWSVASTVIFPDQKKSYPLTTVWLAGAFTHIRITAGDTSLWPVATAEIDVQFTSPSGHIVSTETVQFKVICDVTDD